MGFERVAQFDRRIARPDGISDLTDRQPNYAAAAGILERPSSLSAMTRPPPRITILLSTYNGENYLRNQLDSFLQQEEVDWRLAWRDDGSSDASEAIMEEFAREAGARRCVKSPSSGSHLGAAASFLRLLSENQDSSFIAFADQDDHWLPEKLRRSLFLLGTSGGQPAVSTPSLYCARQMLTDDHFNHLAPSMKFEGSPGFPACLTQNAATGNTVVMNQAAARLISAIPLPEASTHDWWSYIVVSACGGRVVYDEVPSMLYRQHAKNLIGSNMRIVGRAKAALRRGRSHYMTMMRRHTERLHEYREQLHPQAIADLRLIRTGLAGGYADRISALRCPCFTRATRLETILFRLWFLTF